MALKKILYVEDDPLLLALLSGKLTEAGFGVLTTATGAEGFAKAKAERPNIILLDIMLPDMSGFDLLGQLKNDPETQAIPVIILSNLGGREEIEKAGEFGATSYIIKSNIVPQEVADMVYAELQKAELSAPAQPPQQ